jgi:diguanylate cyclase (GGDEF)-like protein
MAQRMREMLRVADTGPLPLTVSIGIVSNTPTTRGWERLLSHADDAMYEAKRAGKDRAVVHQEHIQQLMNALRAAD